MNFINWASSSFSAVQHNADPGRGFSSADQFSIRVCSDRDVDRLDRAIRMLCQSLRDMRRPRQFDTRHTVNKNV
jgi:hypothetical protein